ncbi:MAG TPA: MFS transporter [Actinomycetes bacterium]|nr:MFS transporter [Actinomycetes bacterium]
MSQSQSHGTAIQRRSPIGRVALGSFIGTSIEWYDFFLYGTAAALVFSELFFPNVSPAVGLIAAFGTYAVGFLARPLGGIIGGHLGDRIGRKAVLVASLTIMGAATAAIGLLPSYDQIGLWAPALLLVLRLTQGLGVGGEWGGAALMTVEHAPAARRGLFGSFTQIGVSAGMLLSVGAFAVVRNSVDHATFLAWGWRVPFLASTILVAIGLWIRLKLEETPQFARLADEGGTSARPVVTALRDERKAVLLTTGMRLSQNAVYYIYTVFGLAYVARSLGKDTNIGLISIVLASALGLVSVPLWAALSDRIGRRPVYLLGSVASAIFIFPFFLLADSGNPVLIVLAIVIGLNGFHDAMYGPQAAFFSEMFTTGVRYSGASLGYQIGSVLAGGFSPLIATALLAVGGGRPWLVCGYFLLLSSITTVCAYLAPETVRGEIGDAAPGRSRLARVLVAEALATT